MRLRLTLDNIAYGIIAGLILYILIHNVPLLLGKISPRLLPPGWHDLKEPYSPSAMLRRQQALETASLSSGSASYKPGAGSTLKALLPPWLRKALNGNKTFWAYTPEEVQRHLEGREMTARQGIDNAQLRQAERDEMRKQLGIERDNGESLPSHYDLERAHTAHGQQSMAHDSASGGGRDKEYEPRAPIDPEAFKQRV